MYSVRMMWRRIPGVAAAGMALLLLAGGCDEPQIGGEETGQPPIVVEGWIEEGKTPVVIVSRALDLADDSISFENSIEKWCRVSIFEDGERTLLTARIDDNYAQRFIYTSSRLRGKLGKEYRLMIECEEDTIESTERLLPCAAIERMEAEPVNDSDSLYSIRCYLRDVDSEAFYRVQTQTLGKDLHSYAAFMSTISGADYDAQEGMKVTRGSHSGYEEEEFSHFFSSGETVLVKVCRISEANYQFWRVYDSNVALGGNLFFNATENCVSNLSQGLGYWGAYGISESAIRIPSP